MNPIVRRVFGWIARPTLFFALFVLIGAVADISDLRLHFVDPLISSLTNMSGLPAEYIKLALVGCVAWGLFRTLLILSGFVKSVTS